MEVHGALGYVLGAYSVFAVLLVAYGSIMAARSGRVRRQLAALRPTVEERGPAFAPSTVEERDR